MTAAAQQILRFRGTWSQGTGYEAGDVCVTGRWSWECICSHVSGQQSQPGHGEHWARNWQPIEGFGSVAAPALTPIAAAAPRSAAVIHLAPPASRDHLPAVAAPASPPATAGGEDALLGATAPVPVRIPSTSEIPDDSEIGMPNLAMALSWVKAMLGQMARREDLEADFRELEAQLRALAARLGSSPPLDPVRAEAARRKALVLGVSTAGEVDDAERRMVRKMLQLLRKRETGADYTAQDAAMAAILDELVKALGEIDDAADALAENGLPNVAEDANWPLLTRPA